MKNTENMFGDMSSLSDEEFELLLKEQFRPSVELAYDVIKEVLGKFRAEQEADFELEHVMLENINDLYEE